jgi:hypothetical protein
MAHAEIGEISVMRAFDPVVVALIGEGGLRVGRAGQSRIARNRTAIGAGRGKRSRR